MQESAVKPAAPRSDPSGSPLIGLAARATALVGIAIVAVQILRDGSRSEAWDRAVYLIAAAVGLLCMFATLRKGRSPAPSGVAAGVAILVCMTGLYGIESHVGFRDYARVLWLGFGPWVLALVLLLVPGVFSLYARARLPGPVRSLLAAVATAVLLAMLPAVWQGSSSLMDVYHSSYSINENLAVAAGRLPYVQTAPQYGTLYAWLVAPFASMMTPDGLVQLSLAMMSVANIVALLLGVWLVHAASGRQSLALAALTVLPLSCIGPFPDRDFFSGTIFALPGFVPTRVFPGVVIGAGLVTAWCLAARSTARRAMLCVSMYLAGLNLWHSPDFGLALLVTMLILLFILERDAATLACGLCAMLLGALTYPLAGIVAGFAIDPALVGTFLLGFGSGFGAEPIITPGPVLIVLPLMTTMAAISTGLLLRERLSGSPLPAALRRAVITCALFSLWSAAAFPYYLNRSFASGQMQVLLLPLSIALGAFLHFMLGMDDAPRWTARSFFSADNWRAPRLGRSLALFCLAMFMALPLASLIAFPQPAAELQRLSDVRGYHRWPQPGHGQLLEDFERLRSADPRNTGYFGIGGNYYQLLTGVPSLNIFNSPQDLSISAAIMDRACAAIIASGARTIVVDAVGAEVAAAFPDGRLCGVYSPVPLTGPRLMVRE